MSYNNLSLGRYTEKGRAYFITTVLHTRVKNTFADFGCARILIQQMRKIQDSGDVNSIAWVVMPDHVHWLFQLTSDLPMPQIVKRFKGASARQINLHLGFKGVLWQKAFYDHALRKEEEILRISRYIVANPLRAGLVDNIADYPHWDSIWMGEL